MLTRACLKLPVVMGNKYNNDFIIKSDNEDVYGD